jgi:hypothetical protein
VDRPLRRLDAFLCAGGVLFDRRTAHPDCTDDDIISRGWEHPRRNRSRRFTSKKRTMANASAGLEGLHLVVSDIDAARAELTERGTDVSEIYHFTTGGQMPGPDPQRSDYGSFLSFSDPDGNGWLVQEVGRTKPGS